MVPQHLLGNRNDHKPEKIETRKADRENGQHDIQVADQTINPSTQAR